MLREYRMTCGLIFNFTLKCKANNLLKVAFLRKNNAKTASAAVFAFYVVQISLFP